jgi:hypothetical protein
MNESPMWTANWIGLAALLAVGAESGGPCLDARLEVVGESALTVTSGDMGAMLPLVG